MLKKRFLGIVTIIIGLMLVLGFTACDTSSGGGGPYTVKYEITGPATIASLVTYQNENGSMDSLSNVSIPWTKTITVNGKMAVGCGASISGNLYNGDTYVAKIFVNGKEVKSATTTSVSVTVSHYLN